MNHELIETLLRLLLRSSLQAGVLVVLILALQHVFRRRLPARWHSALWLLVMIRLLLPVSWPSAVSVFNLAATESPLRPVPGGVGVPGIGSPGLAEPASASADEGLFVSPGQTRPSSFEPFAGGGPGPAAAPEARLSLPVVWFLLWLAGVAGFGVMVARTGLRASRRYGGRAPVVDSSLLSLLEDCRRRMGVRAPVRLGVCERAVTPVLFGFLHPELLLPPVVVRSFSRRELEMVFLHELAHVKRRDLWLNWLVAALQAIHWFNPLLWLGFARWRADRELACDAMALEVAGQEGNADYGRTILRLLEGWTPGEASPGVVGILEDRRQLRRRITRIAAFSPGPRWRVLAAALACALGAVTLTDAQKAAPQNPATATGTAIGVGPAVDPGDTATLRGLIRDERGDPIHDAYVVFGSGTNRTAKTDRDGRFVLERVPARGEYRICRWGCLTIEGTNLNAGADEIEITLRRSLQFRARVIDAETQRPIPDFLVVPGTVQAQSGKARWLWTEQSSGRDGACDVGFPADPFFMASDGRFLVEAPGYQGAASPTVPLGRGDVTMDFALRKAGPLRGRVLAPDDRPVRGAMVRLWDGELNLKDLPSSREAVTKKDGAFELAPSIFDRLLVSHQFGYATVMVSEWQSGQEIRLRAGGSVSGTVRLGGSPASETRVTLQPIFFKYEAFVPSHSNGRLSVTTDADGRFNLKDVPEGEYWLAIARSRRQEFDGGYSTAIEFSHGTPVLVRPGLATNVNLGGGGQTVIGRAEVPGSDSIRWKNAGGELRLMLPPIPDKPRVSTSDYPQTLERAGEPPQVRAFWTSAEGRSRQRATRVYVATFRDDGSFRFDDIPPGRYRLSFSAFSPGPKTEAARKPGMMYGATSEVLVPKPGDSVPAVDLGVLKLEGPYAFPP